jgi:hypothetical protein
MAGAVETTRSEVTYELDLEHTDIVDMMNDADLESGDVDVDQEFELVLRRANGSDILLKDMTTTDTLVIRYKKVTIESA